MTEANDTSKVESITLPGGATFSVVFPANSTFNFDLKRFVTPKTLAEASKQLDLCNQIMTQMEAIAPAIITMHAQCQTLATSQTEDRGYATMDGDYYCRVMMNQMEYIRKQLKQSHDEAIAVIKAITK